MGISSQKWKMIKTKHCEHKSSVCPGLKWTVLRGCLRSRWSPRPRLANCSPHAPSHQGLQSHVRNVPPAPSPLSRPSPAQRRHPWASWRSRATSVPCDPPSCAPKTPEERGNVCRWWKCGSAHGRWAPPLGFFWKTTCCQSLRSPPRHTAQGPPQPALLLWLSISGRLFADTGHREFHEPDAQTAGCQLEGGWQAPSAIVTPKNIYCSKHGHPRSPPAQLRLLPAPQDSGSLQALPNLQTPQGLSSHPLTISPATQPVTHQGISLMPLSALVA